jgi:putative DNA primase/helicase
MIYMSNFYELALEQNPEYPYNDIGAAKLFSDIHTEKICYVIEAKTWYVYNGRYWEKDGGGFKVMEMCKQFVQDYHAYLNEHRWFDEDCVKFIEKIHSRKRRETILNDAHSVAPMSLSEFDRDKLLFNCMNGTYNLAAMTFQPHSPSDRITKMSRASYEPESSCGRWEKFVHEIMCGDDKTAQFLQKAFGYCLSGETSFECFFILYGSTTRNGKSTACETISHILKDYARTAQAETLAKRVSNGSAPSPDIARLKGARYVGTPEPAQGLELNASIVKQLTGGDTYTGRMLRENPVEFTPEFKIFMNTNHLPRTTDNTIFSSGRVKLIPFDRHFSIEEQDTGLKKLFRQKENMSGILNWLIEGCRLLSSEGLATPPRVAESIAQYTVEDYITGDFLREILVESDGKRLQTSAIYKRYAVWSKENGYRPTNCKFFVNELRRKYEIRRDGRRGNEVLDVDFA